MIKNKTNLSIIIEKFKIFLRQNLSEFEAFPDGI